MYLYVNNEVMRYMCHIHRNDGMKEWAEEELDRIRSERKTAYLEVLNKPEYQRYIKLLDVSVLKESFQIYVHRAYYPNLHLEVGVDFIKSVYVMIEQYKAYANVENAAYDFAIMALEKMYRNDFSFNGKNLMNYMYLNRASILLSIKEDTIPEGFLSAHRLTPTDASRDCKMDYFPTVYKFLRDYFANPSLRTGLVNGREVNVRWDLTFAGETIFIHFGMGESTTLSSFISTIHDWESVGWFIVVA